MKIWTDDAYIEVDPNDVGELEAAMLFKAEHIKEKADPELFAAVAEMLSRLWDSATKRVDVVRCRECKYFLQYSEKYKQEVECADGDCFIKCLHSEEVQYCPCKNDDYCSFGERRDSND